MRSLAWTKAVLSRRRKRARATKRERVAEVGRERRQQEAAERQVRDARGLERRPGALREPRCLRKRDTVALAAVVQGLRAMLPQSEALHAELVRRRSVCDMYQYLMAVVGIMGAPLFDFDTAPAEYLDEVDRWAAARALVVGVEGLAQLPLPLSP
jgi:hypothetical protein